MVLKTYIYICDNNIHKLMKDINFMKTKTRRSYNSSIAIGIAFLWVGMVMLLNRMDIIPYTLKKILISWPILLTYIGLIGLFRKEKVGGLIMTIIGLVFLFLRIGNTYPGLIPSHFLNIDLYFWPLVIILIGFIFIFYFGISQSDSATMNKDGNQYVKSSFMSEYSENYDGKIFEGGSFKSTLSSTTIDLRGALVKSDTIYIDLSVFLAGVDLYIPNNCTIEDRTKVLLGEVDDKRRGTDSSLLKEFKLIITGSIILGGVEIRN